MEANETLEQLRPHLDVDKIRSWLAQQDQFTTDWAVTYFGEALFFAKTISAKLGELPDSARVLEIGGGIGFVSRVLALRGHRVTCFEPSSRGFSRMAALNQLVESAWKPAPPSIEWRAEPFSSRLCGSERFGFIFATNVLQHVASPASLVAEAASLLAPGGSARFICPNYSIPYDPHFNIPTFWSKRFAYRLFRRRIIAYPLQESPQALWEDLSFPSAGRLLRDLSRVGISAHLSRDIALAYGERLSEPRFIERKGSTFRLLVRPLRRPLQRTLELMPPRLLPLVDLRIDNPV